MAIDEKNDTDKAMQEFMTAAEAMNAGMSDLVASAMRMQMLMMEDAQSMMAEMAAFSAAMQKGQAESGTASEPADDEETEGVNAPATGGDGSR